MAAVLVLCLLAVAAAGCRDRRGDDAPPDTTPPAATTGATSSPSTATPSFPPATASATTSVPATPIPTATAPPPAARLTPGTTGGTIQHDDLAREYILFVPPIAARQDALPLVVGLHGGLGGPAQFAANSELTRLALSEGFVAVYPAGFERTWNGGACCGQAAAHDIDDVGFLAALIEQLTASPTVDPGRVYVTGHSNGGIMAFRLACERADLVAAIVPVAGSLEVDTCAPSSPVAVLAIHGDADLSHPFEGGEGPRSIAGVAFRPMPDSLALWAAGARCTAGPSTSASGAVTTWEWSGCPGGAVTRMLVIAGADHPWPGSSPSPNDRAGEPSQVLDASAAAWEFFRGIAKPR
ncbi:MAG: prolyl oligopeptidase family serine peptidase [Dehalococcoidia bacterium]|nr:prolyl oligopeptidase family serine peptidase [Dehalococcoidia bacterium]